MIAMMNEELSELIKGNHFAAGLRKACEQLGIIGVEDLMDLQEEEIMHAELPMHIKTALSVFAGKVKRGEPVTNKRAVRQIKVVYKLPTKEFMIEYLKERGYKVYKEC